MPQYRKLYTKTTESLDINEMPDDFTRLLWLLLPLIVCREGRGMDNPAWIKAKAMPLREDVTQDRVEAAMTWYATRGMIARYKVDGRGYFQIVNWARYQGDTQREAESNYPGQDQANEAINSRPTHDLLTTNSCSDADADADADTNTVQTQNTKKPRTPKPKAVIPPAVLAFQECARKMPHKTLWDNIAATVGETDRALTLWRKVIVGYIAMGWNPTNIAGMLDYFKRGEIPAPKNNGNGRNGTPAVPTNTRPPGLSEDDYMALEYIRYNHDDDAKQYRAELEAKGVKVDDYLETVS